MLFIIRIRPQRSNARVPRRSTRLAADRRGHRFPRLADVPEPERVAVSSPLRRDDDDAATATAAVGVGVGPATGNVDTSTGRDAVKLRRHHIAASPTCCLPNCPLAL